MRVVGAAEVEAARGTDLVVGERDIVTALARERAEQLGVRIVAGHVAARAGAGTGVDLGQLPPVDPGPPSGALFRRGAPVPATLAAPGVRTVGGPVVRARAAAGTTRTGRVARVVVVGAGHVGMIAALRIAEADVVEEVVLVDLVEGLAAGIALDIAHTGALSGFSTRVRGAGSVEQAGPAEYYVVTAGRPRTPGMSRTDLVSTNAAVVDGVCRAVAVTSPEAVVVVVTNPLDEMTYQAWRSTGFPASRVVGMAGVLDTARFRALVALEAGVTPKRVEAVALGSHGEEMVIPLSRARIAGAGAGEPLGDRLALATVDALVERARGSGAEIVGLLGTGSAFMAPGTSAAHMVLAMARDDGTVLPAAVMADGAYGLRDVFIGLPARLGRHGVREVVEVALTPAERAALVEAARRVGDRVAALAASGRTAW